MTLVTSLNNHDIIMVLLQWIIKQEYDNKYLVIGDRSQASPHAMVMLCSLLVAPQ